MPTDSNATHTKDRLVYEQARSLLGPGARFEGSLVFEGTVRIDGELRGDIRGHGLLVVGPEAVIDAKVDIESLIVLGGKVSGSVVASRVVELHAPSQIYGEVLSPNLVVEKGVIFHGKCGVDHALLGPAQSSVDHAHETIGAARASAKPSEGQPASTHS